MCRREDFEHLGTTKIDVIPTPTYEIATDQGNCPNGHACKLGFDMDGNAFRHCPNSGDGYSGLPLVDTVYRVNADQRIVDGWLITRDDIDVPTIQGQVVDAINRDGPTLEAL